MATPDVFLHDEHDLFHGSEMKQQLMKLELHFVNDDNYADHWWCKVNVNLRWASIHNLQVFFPSTPLMRTIYQYQQALAQALVTSCTKKSKSDGGYSGDENLSKKDIPLKQSIDQINTSHGKGSIMFLGQCAFPRQVPVLSTGSFSLDSALAIGGFPKVRVVEIYGP
ncbi:DNA repair protein recA homolog 3, mitochondrial-like [Rutidosis leptorrhynchoides]|uniref:DNA repair protein recA homolog 3, mitochondrial-like n=1 Tax=Rutidosis leptorrhynchoides TaxID=125765 RepID=UPI003A98D199